MTAGKLLPFFTYYGGKWRAARHYPPPSCRLIVEPFAGSAGYALNWPDRDVLLRDTDPNVVGTWQFLLSATPEDVLALPDLEPDQSTRDLDVPEGARLLIGWWLSKGSASPKLRPSTFALNYPQGGPYWGPRVRQRIADQLPRIRHWQVQLGTWQDAPDVHATWLVDPPYVGAGHHYRHGSAGIDYPALAFWSARRRGQVLVCEADSADWLPFRPLVRVHGTEGRQQRNRARMETLWSVDCWRGCT